MNFWANFKNQIDDVMMMKMKMMWWNVMKMILIIDLKLILKFFEMYKNHFVP